MTPDSVHPIVAPPFSQHVWLFFIAMMVIDAFVLKFRSRTYIQQKPERAAGYDKLFKGILFWGNLPWVVMGAGILSGKVPHMFSYFNPRAGNPFVLAWFGLVVAYWLMGFYWIFARGGAEFLVEHPGMIRPEMKNPLFIRLFYCLMVAGGVMGMIMAFIMDFPA